MITVTPLKDLGHFKNDWLEARYHFSFADYRDPARMGWGTLRVWNDDAIQPGGLFPPHPHPRYHPRLNRQRAAWPGSRQQNQSRRKKKCFVFTIFWNPGTVTRCACF